MATFGIVLDDVYQNMVKQSARTAIRNTFSYFLKDPCHWTHDRMHEDLYTGEAFCLVGGLRHFAYYHECASEVACRLLGFEDENEAINFNDNYGYDAVIALLRAAIDLMEDDPPQLTIPAGWEVEAREPVLA